MKKKRFLILLIVSAISILIIGYSNLSSSKINNLKIDSNAIDYQLSDELEDSDSSTIMIPAYRTLYMSEGDTLSMYLDNPEENSCYFEYTFTLTETNQEIYRSDWIKPGESINDVKLNTNLSKGVYELKILVSTRSLGDFDTIMNSGEIITELVVQ